MTERTKRPQGFAKALTTGLVVATTAFVLASCGRGTESTEIARTVTSAPSTVVATAVPTNVPTTAPTTTAPTTAPAAPATTAASRSARVDGTPVDPSSYGAPGASAGEIVRFTSPSGNIECNIGLETEDRPSFARCDIARYTYTPPPRPADCDLDWGVAIEITGFACVGDAVLPGDTLPYGSTVTHGEITCASREDGVTCIDREKGGRGFRVAKASYERF